MSTLALTRTELVRLRAEHPALDRLFVTVLVRYLRAQRSRLADALCLPVGERVLRLVAAMSQEYGDGGRGTVVPLSQEVLACMAGTTRPTVNQVLRAAERDGLLTILRGRIRVEDPRALAVRAGGERVDGPPVRAPRTPQRAPCSWVAPSCGASVSGPAGVPVLPKLPGGR